MAKLVKDVNYTIPGLLALFGIVLVTALYFTPGIAYRASGDATKFKNVAGFAYETEDITAPQQACESASWCDGTKLIRQHDDCRQFTAFCTQGCLEKSTGAQCR